MIVVRLYGGLGNQMFQYALGKRLALLHGTSLAVDTTYLNHVPRNSLYFTKREFGLDVFDLNIKNLSVRQLYSLPYCDTSFLHRVKHKVKTSLNLYKLFDGYSIVREREPFKYDSAVLNCGRNAYLVGYWQNERYFKDVSAELKMDFVVNDLHTENVRQLAREISKVNSVCIHVRRGDFVTNPSHGLTGSEYISSAVSRILSKTSHPVFYVFSDDIKWCEQNLGLKCQHSFVPEEYAGIKASSHFYLMTKCRHFVLSNSTFGWWAAWLAESSEKIVIAPKQWVNVPGIDASDIVPGGWIVM